MLNRNVGFAAFVVILAASGFASSQTMEIATDLFKKGRFVEAERALPKKSEDYGVFLLKGHLALLGNKYAAAKHWLEKALKLKQKEKMPQQLLAELFYRTNDFQRASKLFQALGRESVAKKLASFAGKRPYQIDTSVQETNIKFIKTDPLPIVTAKINGGEDLYFLIDTGGAELIVDSDYAASNNLRQFGSESGTFGGGQKSNFQHGKINSFTLGDFTIKNVPINILKTQRFAPALGVKRVDGIIGSILLSRFISTIDYQNEKLILRKNTKANLEKLGKAIEIPFWMAGDHFMVAWGTVNKSSQLFFIDTGLAGMGFTCPDSTLSEANIELENQTTEGISGGGSMRLTPFVVSEIKLGDAKQFGVAGVAGAFPPSLENSLGFRIGGLVSHSFFKPYKLTLDFTNMRVLLVENSSETKEEVGGLRSVSRPIK